MDVRNHVFSVRNVTTDVRNCYMRIDRKFGLEADGQERKNGTMKERTLKIWRILFRFNFQVLIACLSSFELKKRETTFFFPSLITFLCISATALSMIAW